MAHMGFMRHFSGVVEQLCSDGHEVELLFASGASRNQYDRALLNCQVNNNHLTTGWMTRRRGVWRWPLSAARELNSYQWYLRFQNCPSPRLSRVVMDRQRCQLPLLLRAAVGFGPVQQLLLNDGVAAKIRRIEAIAPPVPEIIGDLKSHPPDVVVASPVILPHSQEVEYVKAAKALGIPAVVAVASWDHPTTKGVFQIIPDLTLVWNDSLAQEVVDLHGVPKERVAVTGAPTFDRWFAMSSSLDREAFCRTAGIEPDRSFFTYLCSSPFIARDEHLLVQEFSAFLQSHPDTSVRSAVLLVRPHPINASIWKDFRAENTRVWPSDGGVLDSSEERQDYFHTLYHSAGVIGLNTSAFIEAAIVDKPCCTVISERFRSTQQEMKHFQHLINGDFIHIANDFQAAGDFMKDILQGQDPKAQNRSKFVSDFVRPMGIANTASSVMANAVERIARDSGGGGDQ